MTRLDRSSKWTVCLLATSIAAIAHEKKEPTAAELSRNETPAKAFLRTFENQEYEFRSAAEVMPATKWDYRPAAGMSRNEKLEFGPSEARTLAEQVKQMACGNFAFAAELDGTKPLDACDKGGPSPAKTSVELLTYLRDSFAARKKPVNEITVKNMYDPIEGPYAGPSTRLGLAGVCIWHAADRYRQVRLYLRENGIVPPASRANPPKLKTSTEYLTREEENGRRLEGPRKCAHSNNDGLGVVPCAPQRESLVSPQQHLMSRGDTMTSDTLGLTGSSRAGVASKELRGRIRRIHLEESLAMMACHLCMDEVPVEEAFQKIQDKALEKMVTLLDAGILGDSAVVKSCLEVVAKESERVAWQALEKGSAMLEEGLAILEGELELPDSGYVN